MERMMQHSKNFKLKMKETIKTPLKVMRRFSNEFSNNSNIHGVRYFTERFLHWTERLWWIVAISVSLWLCGLMIRNVWTEWDERPTKLDTTGKTHISKIPFPTVMICPDIKVIKQKLDISSKFTKVNETPKLVANLSDIEATQIKVLAHICTNLQHHIKFEDDFANESIYNIIEDMAPKVEYVMKECRWQQKKINCSEYISPMLIRKGLCYTFNALNSHDLYTDEIAPHMMIAKSNRNLSLWSLESGYRKEIIESEYPVRVSESGRKTALELILTSDAKDIDFMCDRLAEGFTPYLALPNESLEYREKSAMELSENVMMTVKPKLKTTSEGLRKYKPMYRGCFFNSERKLRFFRSYTEHSCDIECVANYTKASCGCVQYYMPRDANTKICGTAKIKCYDEALFNYASDYGLAFRKKCNCLPSCVSIEYERKVDRISMRTGNQTNVVGPRETRLSIFFEDDYIDTENRLETYTVGDFLAICGGLLGLFLGISLLSIIELIYYSTLRLFWLDSHRNTEQTQEREIQSASHVDENAWIDENRTVRRKIFRLIFNVRKFCTEFLDKSNIHGVRYFSERMLHWSERLWWLVAFGVSLWMCGSMIHNVWIQWIEDPVTFRYTEKRVRGEFTPFPMVTICPAIKTTKDKFDVSALSSLSNLSDIEMTRLNALAHICPPLSHLIEYKENFTDQSIYNTIQDISPNIRESLIKCQWRNHQEHCSNLLNPVLTDEGLCFTFNALNSHEMYTDEMAPEMMIVKSNRNISGWSLDGGYTNESVEGNYPFQAIYKGRKNTLVSLLQTYLGDVKYQCRGYDNGFKMILNMPGEIVETSHNYLRLPLSQVNHILIKKKLIITSEGLRSYTPNQRQCFYTSDHPLRFFKIYTKANCEAECLANFTRIECGCVKFSMPRDKHTRICGAANVKCYKTAQRNLLTNETGELFREKCNCLPSCTSIEYGEKHQRTTSGYLRKLNPNPKLSSSLFSLNFDSDLVEVVKRKEMYSFSDFLAVCGSLLGLFLGISFLSIIELIYYSTLRLFWTIRMKRNNC